MTSPRALTANIGYRISYIGNGLFVAEYNCSSTLRWGSGRYSVSMDVADKRQYQIDAIKQYLYRGTQPWINVLICTYKLKDVKVRRLCQEQSTLFLLRRMTLSLSFNLLTRLKKVSCLQYVYFLKAYITKYMNISTLEHCKNFPKIQYFH